MDEVDVGVSSEFPRIGDKLVVAGAGGPYEAEVRNDHDTGLEWIRYIEGYRVAARATFAVAQADRSNVERVVFPVVFLYRHHCELCLKAIRVIGGALLGLPTEFQAVHYFDKLWPLSLEIIQRRWGGKDPQLIATVRAQLYELGRVDPGSFSNRYPVEAKDQSKSSHPDAATLDLGHFVDVIERLCNFLESCAYGLWCEVGVQEEMGGFARLFRYNFFAEGG